MKPRLSVVILTLNEEQSIGGCLESLANQSVGGFETIIVDADSQDETVARAQEAAVALPGPFRLHKSDVLLPIGAARNLGARLAKAPIVAYLSADADLDPRWIEYALEALEAHDMAFGRQVHAPRQWTTAAAVRGLRYRFPDHPSDDAARFASNVAGAFCKEILLRFPFDEDACAAEDLVIALDAQDAGYRARYDPRMVAFHHDVATPREELRKNLREGEGWALYRSRLGLAKGWLLWGAGLAGAAGIAATHRWGLAAVAGVLWAPALRRAMRRHSDLPPLQLVKAVLVSPAYDLAFLAKYLRGLSKPARRAREVEA